METQMYPLNSQNSPVLHFFQSFTLTEISLKWKQSSPYVSRLSDCLLIVCFRRVILGTIVLLHDPILATLSVLKRYSDKPRCLWSNAILWLQNKATSSLLHHRADTLCLVFIKYRAVPTISVFVSSGQRKLFRKILFIHI